MSGVILFSDTHFSNRSAFGRFESNPDFPGCNSRFHHIARTLINALDYAKKNDCETFFILGDVFHERGVIQVPVYKAVYDILDQQRNFPVYMFPGNHDVCDIRAMYSDKGLNSLFAFDKQFEGLETTVASEPYKWASMSFASIVMLPFSSNEKKLVEMSYSMLPKKDGKLRVLMLHHSFTGASSGPHEWKMPNAIDIDDLCPDYDLIFSGHYHKHQTLVGKKNILTYVGSPLQHDFGERTYTPGFIHLLPNGSWKHIENDFSPKFDIIETSNPDDLLLMSSFRNDYVSVKWTGDSELLKDIKLSDNIILDTTPQSSTVEVRTSIKTTDSVEEQLQKYVEVKADGSKEYLDKGISLYKEK